MTVEILACDDLDAVFRDFSLRRTCDVIGKNTLRVSTPFLYPDGSYIDLFLEQDVSLEKPGQHLLAGYYLSDLGETAAYLYGLRVNLLSQKRRQMVSDICRTLDVEFDTGQLQVALEPGKLSRLPDAVVRLGQACIRVSDFAFSQRFPVAGTFSDDVEEFVDQLGLRYETEVPLPGKYGKEVSVDFRVFGPKKPSLMKTVSPANPTAAHELVNEALSRWIGLRDYRQECQLLTVLQDKEFSYRPDDIEKLREFSNGVYQFPSGRDQLRQALAGEPVAA